MELNITNGENLISFYNKSRPRFGTAFGIKLKSWNNCFSLFNNHL